MEYLAIGTVVLAVTLLLIAATLASELPLDEVDEVEVPPSEEELYHCREEHFRQYVLGMAERED